MDKSLFVLIAAVCTPVFMSLAVFILSKRPRKKTNADVIIVLGAKVCPDGTPSNTLRYRLDIFIEETTLSTNSFGSSRTTELP